MSAPVPEVMSSENRLCSRNERLPFSGHFLELCRIVHKPLSVRDTIVFLHDSFGCIEAWKEFPEAVARATGWDGLVYDRRGYGKSSTADPEPRGTDYLHREAGILIEILDRCKLEQAVLLGHSDGGSIALLAAALYPERITAVITEGAHVFVEEIGLQGIREAVRQYDASDLKARLERYHGEKTEWVFRAWSETWLSREFRDWNIEDVLPSIRCPVLIIQGEGDEYGTLDQARAIVRGVGGCAERLIVPKAGHSPHRETPDHIISCVHNFLQKVKSAE